jgi:PAS domain S-box-containing protein
MRETKEQEKFSALFDAIPDAAVFLDLDFSVVEANRRFGMLFGYSIDEVKGKVVTDLIVPDVSEEDSKVIRQKILLGPVETVATRKRKDGSEVVLLLSGGPVVVNGRVVGSIMVYRDISDVVTVEAALNGSLARAELLNESLSIVGGFLRHDVRNKLVAINANVYLLRKKAGDVSAVLKCADSIKQISGSIAEILDISRTIELWGNETLRFVDVGEVFEVAVSSFSELGDVRVINKCIGVVVLADSILSVVFRNLIENSIKYAGKLGQIRLYSLKNSDGSLCIFYEDDGVGIDAAIKKHLFQKGVGKGTGLGLYLIKKTVDLHGWNIEEIGSAGGGVKFVITVPKLAADLKNHRSFKR